jgi:preprotein translocase subunit SecG
MFTFFLTILILASLTLGVAVLLQAGTGGGLAAMGGGASTDSFLGGRQAATILTKATWWLGGVFLGLSLVLAGLSARSSQPTSVLDTMQPAPTPVAPAPSQGQPQLPIDVEPAEPAETPPQN